MHLRWRSLALVSALLAGLAGSAAADDPRGAAPAPRLGYADGARWVDVERLDLAPSGRRRVRLHHDTGVVVFAEVDATAIVRVGEASAADLAARGVRLVRPLMPSRGLWLAEAVDGGDGLDVARRVPGATPNLYLKVRAKEDPFTPNDPRFGGQWYFENLRMPEAWGVTRGSADTTVVVVDTGCDLAHPDLASKMDPGRDVVDHDDDPSYEPTDSGAEHGTECAGLIGAATDNDEGIAGACPECRLRCVRFLSDEPVPLSADIEAFQFALDVDADVVSNSWGYVEPTPAPAPLVEAIAEVATNGRGGRGAIVVFAAGNDDRELGDDEIENAPGVLCVGAINNLDDATPFTNRGNAIDVVAPTGTLTTDISGPGGADPTDYTSLFGGTSSACPVVAGVAGLLVSWAPDRTGSEITDAIIRTARPAPFAVPDERGHDPLFGYGIIDPLAALDDLGGAGEGGAGGATAAPSATASTAEVASVAAAGGSEAATEGESDDGCGCEVVGTSATGGRVTAALAAAIALVLSRRASGRRR